MRGAALLLQAMCASCQDVFLPSTRSHAPGPDSPGRAPEAPPRRPHIVFLLSDDLGWNNVGFHNFLVRTPSIDALRLQGIELSRHYAYKFCSPSRSSFLTGRLPVHVNERNADQEAPLAGVHPAFTMIPAMLKRAGYKSHHVGKWHCGVASRSTSIPVARGFDTSLGFFHGGVDHYTQRSAGTAGCGQAFADLWLDHDPAVGLNGTDYSLHLWRDRALSILRGHDPSTPLFLYVAFANNHRPLQCPGQYMSSYPVTATEDWRTYQGMTTGMDDAVGKIADALRRKGMWENCLVVWSSDNGGPECQGATNYPLRGGKVSNWEGGLRVRAVVSGGVVPLRRRGSAYAGITHVADWWATFAALAGLPARDAPGEAAGLPPVDGHDLRAALFGGAPSPWTSKPLYLVSHASEPAMVGFPSDVLVLDDHKLVTGISLHNGWSGHHSPNASWPRGPCSGPSWFDCGLGCLYNVVDDQGEHVNLAQTKPGKLAELRSLVFQLAPSVYDPDRGDPGTRACDAALAAGGYWAPWLP